MREFTPSKDGIESQFAANHVGHFLLANLIVEKLAVESSFVTVTSSGYGLAEQQFDDYNFHVSIHYFACWAVLTDVQEGKTYNPWFSYAQAVTAKILLAYAFGKKAGVAAFSVDPGCKSCSYHGCSYN